MRSIAARRGAAPDGARRGRGAHRPGDHTLSGRSVQDLRPERGARQHRDGARDARQGCLEDRRSNSPRSRPSRRDSWIPWVPFTWGSVCSTKRGRSSIGRSRRGAACPSVDPLDLSDSLSHQGDLLALQAEYDAGEKAYREAIRIERRGRRTIRARWNSRTRSMVSARCSPKQGRLPEADKNLREALTLQQTLYGDFASGDRTHAQGSRPHGSRRRRSQRRDPAHAARRRHAAATARH